ncbi:MAG: hypothetical protein ABSE86_00670 [Bryobacteraceae bacterium]
MQVLGCVFQVWKFEQGRKDDSWYIQAFEQAVLEVGDSLQDKLTEMAFEGNVTAGIFLLKGLKPERFRGHLEQTNLLEIDPDKLTPRQLDVIAAISRPRSQRES